MIWRPSVVGKRSSRVVFGRFWAEASGTTVNASRQRSRVGDKKRHIRTNKLRCPRTDATAFLNCGANHRAGDCSIHLRKDKSQLCPRSAIAATTEKSV